MISGEEGARSENREPSNSGEHQKTPWSGAEGSIAVLKGLPEGRTTSSRRCSELARTLPSQSMTPWVLKEADAVGRSCPSKDISLAHRL